MSEHLHRLLGDLERQARARFDDVSVATAAPVDFSAYKHRPVAFVVADHDLVGRRARPGTGPVNAHAVACELLETHARDIQYAIGRDVARRIVHLVSRTKGYPPERHDANVFLAIVAR